MEHVATKFNQSFFRSIVGRYQTIIYCPLAPGSWYWTRPNEATIFLLLLDKSCSVYFSTIAGTCLFSRCNGWPSLGTGTQLRRNIISRNFRNCRIKLSDGWTVRVYARQHVLVYYFSVPDGNYIFAKKRIISHYKRLHG